jgi:hypothetical protein
MLSLRSRVVSACLSLFLVAPLVEAEVKVKMGPDGRKVIYNESSTQRARRVSGKLMPVPDSELLPVIERHSLAHNVDPKLVRAVIQAESGYNRRALSNKGAIGLMQLMPATAKYLRVGDPWNAEENVRGGTAYLRQLLDRFAGKVELAVAAYNAGPGAVERHRGIPPYRETREYVRRVLGLYQGNDYQTARVTTAAPGGGGTISIARSSSLSAAPAPAATAPEEIRRKPRIIRNAENQIVVTTELE